MKASIWLSVFSVATYLNCQTAEISRDELAGQYELGAESVTVLRLKLQDDGSLTFLSKVDVGGVWLKTGGRFRISDNTLLLELEAHEYLSSWSDFVRRLHIGKVGQNVFLVPDEYFEAFNKSVTEDSLAGGWIQRFHDGYERGYHAFLKVDEFM